MSNTVQPTVEAGPSRRTPIRSLRQPALLNIATRNDAGGLEPPSHSDAVALKLAMERKVQWRRKGERWMDRLCESTVGADEFKQGAKYLEHHQYLETLHERHLNNHCSYPLCLHPPRAPYTSRPRISISRTRKAIEQKEGNEQDGFCSKACKVRSGYVGEQMKEGTGLRGKGWAVELLEEVRPDKVVEKAERKGNATEGTGGEGAVCPSAARERVEETKSASTSAPAGTLRDTGVLAQPILPESRAHTSTQSPPSTSQSASLPTPPPTAASIPKSSIKRPPPKVAPPAPTYPPQPQSALDDLLAGLVIVERPTLPPPSTQNPSVPSSSTAPTPTPVPKSMATPPILPKASSARASSSLIATPLKLASTLITASRLTGPVPQLDADSDAESELSEWEMEMDGFGLGEEEKRLFEEMREARELLGGADGVA